MSASDEPSGGPGLPLGQVSIQQPAVPTAHAPFEIAVHRPTTDTVVVTVRGDLDLSTVPRLGELLRHRQASFAHTVVVDLSQVTFLDCAGVELLCRCQQRAELAATALRLVGDQHGRVLRTMRLAGVDHHFGWCASVSVALDQTALHTARIRSAHPTP